MYEKFWSRVVSAGIALAFIAGCSGSSGSLNAPQAIAPQGYRVLPGPAVSGPILVPLVTHRTNPVPPGPEHIRRHETLYVADLSSSVVDIYDPRSPNPSPISSITTGINSPAGLAVLKGGTLYVSNLGNNTLTVYPKGQTSPSLTITNGVSGPYGMALDSKGDVFISNLNNNTVVGYLAGQTSPFETIDFSSLGQPVGVAVDGNDNVWVACDSTNAVYEIPAGTSTPQNANLTGLAGPIGISFGKQDEMFVSNFSAANVNVYAYGSTTPSETITDGISGPTLNAVTFTGAFFQSNQSANVVGYHKNQTSPFSTITGLSDPLGIAEGPVVIKIGPGPK